MVFSVLVLHTVDTICEEIFASQLDTAREVVHLLVLAHSLVEVVL